MATEADVERFFESMLPKITEIKGRDAGTRVGGNLGCALMLLALAGAVGLIMTLNDSSAAAQALRGWPLVAVIVAGAGVFYLGFKLWRPWFTASSGQREEADRVLLPALADLVLPGATFTRASITLSGYHPSLVIPRPDGVLLTHCGRLEGPLLGRSVTIDELRGGYDNNMGAYWMVRVELPFVVGGHVRMRKPGVLDPGFYWNDGFERHDGEERRLGPGWRLELAPLGAGTPEGVVAPPPGAVPPEAMLTDGLFALLRERPDMRVATTGRDLWIVVERSILAFDSQVPGRDDLPRWKKAVPALEDIAAVTREVLAAGGGRR